MCSNEFESIIAGVDDFEAVADRLESHNKWRRGEDSESMEDPVILGKDLDCAVKACRIMAMLKRNMRK